MDLKHRKLIREKTPFLVQFIDFNAIAPFVIHEKIFTAEMFEDIDSERNDSNRKQKLLNELQTRGPNAFDKFILVLKNAHQNEALACFEDINTSANFNNRYDENNRQPCFKNYSEDNKLPCVINRGDINHIYQMNSMPRGLCIIINNVDFHGVKEFRHGSDVDVERLNTVFNMLGYKVYIKPNLTALEMRNELENFTKLIELENVDSCVVILLSHGSNGYIYGTDDEHVPLSDILLFFDNENCKTLIGKPKLFFIQACRGDDFNGITISLTSDALKIGTAKSGSLNTDEVSKVERIIKMTDTLMSFATVEGYTAVRDHVLGTWYCEALVWCLKEYSLTKELSAILRRVDAEVQRFMGPCGEKQATEVKTIGFHKDFYFNIPEENKQYFH